MFQNHEGDKSQTLIYHRNQKAVCDLYIWQTKEIVSRFIYIYLDKCRNKYRDKSNCSKICKTGSFGDTGVTHVMQYHLTIR